MATEEFIRLIQSIKSLRARRVIEHIQKFGSVTTEDLQKQFGYEHPPRAARDVREAGIELVTTFINVDGRRIASYSFSDSGVLARGKGTGRRAFSKTFKKNLIALNGQRCAVCSQEFEERYLQIDHRIPFQIRPDDLSLSPDPSDFMLVDGECNRKKSWSCEQCPNSISIKKPSICANCYWANAGTGEYSHIAMEQRRRIDISWSGSEVSIFDYIEDHAKEQGLSLQQFIKALLQEKACS